MYLSATKIANLVKEYSRLNPRFGGYDRDEIVSEFDIGDEELPGCCGLLVMHDLGHLVQSQSQRSRDIEAMLWLSDQEAADYMGVLASSANQPDEEKALLRLGFKPLAKGRGPKHGNNITVWILQFTPPQKVPCLPSPKSTTSSKSFKK